MDAIDTIVLVQSLLNFMLVVQYKRNLLDLGSKVKIVVVVVLCFNVTFSDISAV